MFDDFDGTRIILIDYFGSEPIILNLVDYHLHVEESRNQLQIYLIEPNKTRMLAIILLQRQISF